MENPYDKSHEKLVAYLDGVINREKYKLLRKERKKCSAHRRGGSLAKESDPSQPDDLDHHGHEHAVTQEHESSTRSQFLFRGEPITSNELNLLKENNALQKLLRACDRLLYNHGKKTENRIYYSVKILKVVKVYEPFESFGELALITNKRRKAKLEVIGD